jgi:hypothetical protein
MTLTLVIKGDYIACTKTAIYAGPSGPIQYCATNLRSNYSQLQATCASMGSGYSAVVLADSGQMAFLWMNAAWLL